MSSSSGFTSSGDRYALVTGAGRGIGRACALTLARMGIYVAATARTESELLSLQEEIRKSGGHCRTIVHDLADSSSFERFYQSVEAEFGRVDILVNNAGIYGTDSLDDPGPALDLFKTSLDINLSAPYMLCRHFGAAMKRAGWGRIINISSISGQKAEVFGAAYSTTKFGLLGMTQALALELAQFGTTVNAVCPGWVDTKLALDQISDPEWCKLNHIEPSESLDIARLSVPMQRLIQPEEVASLVAFLASEQAAAITGQSINICGGLSIT